MGSAQLQNQWSSVVQPGESLSSYFLLVLFSATSSAQLIPSHREEQQDDDRKSTLQLASSVTERSRMNWTNTSFHFLSVSIQPTLASQHTGLQRFGQVTVVFYCSDTEDDGQTKLETVKWNFYLCNILLLTLILFDLCDFLFSLIH